MPPRRKQRKDDDDDAPVLTRSVAVSSDLPWLASRYDSSYGSAPSALPRNNLSGQFRNLQDIVQDALVDAESDEERRPRGSKSMSMSNTPTSEPTPKPKPKPKTKQKSALLQPESSSNFGLEISNSSDASASTPEVGRGQNTPRRNPTRTVNTGTLLSNLGWPRVTGTPDSTRTFGQESSLFGGAELRSTPSRSPNPDILPTTEGEESPIEEDSYPARRSPTKRLFPPRDQSFQQNNQANGRPAWNGNVSTEAIPRYNTTHDTYRNVPTHSFQQNGQANEPAANHRANSAQQNGGERPQGHSLFGSLMQDSIDQERRVDRAQQAKLHSERRRRLATHPYVYEIVYKVTKLPRPRSPGRVSDDSDSDGSVAFDMRSRQTPTEELPWGSWLLFRLADAFVAVLDLLFPDTPWYQRPAYIMLAVLVGWLLSRLLSTSDAGSDVLGWLGFSGFNAGLRVPLWMSRPSTIFSDDESREIQRQQRDHDYEITKLTKSSNLHDGSLSKLEGIVPKVVHLKLDKNGRPIIAQEFWHALRDLMKGDREILTIDRGRNGYYHISDEHWRATKDRLSQDPVYQKAASPPQPGTSPADVENIFESKLAKTWEKWLKNNDKRVAKILEPAFGTSIPDKIEKGLAQKLEQYVKNLYKDKKGTKDVVVTRDEFIRHLKGEFATHRNEIKAEALELQKKLEQQVQDAVQKAPEAGIARTELMQIIDERVRDAVANAGLEALAQGKITVNWQSQLRKEVNFLSRGRGTIIDAKHMSPVYKPQIKGKVSSPEWLDSTRRSPDVFPPARTLIRWDDEGDCWCGKESVSSKDGRPLGVFVGYLISNEIVPRYIVIEHILPTATLNPEAMPKDMDVWAYFTDLDVRNRVEDFSASHFPSEINNSWLEDGWVKIAQFEYQATEGMDGAHVHQFSPELGNIGAATDQIIVRAVSNHGSDHTCIYRVRLYGDEKKLTW
ncbi:hypothetical protein Cob_v011457 [Colletotrichum orbiculare MAFF 240422]|uniref:SUN domain-containing protein n=1 Tax=Colletotrichum orbiculare (strain 104-T / ATCC 96160 / CBS 514.97 / LARS 414 / MAFF 240422) TaxID=1213857 RepID=A0A484FBN8_COLOR|nr:hypothetical protein Cob_v011457 [Colletotrichum orbiculare MAFF 240422]